MPLNPTDIDLMLREALVCLALYYLYGVAMLIRDAYKNRHRQDIIFHVWPHMAPYQKILACLVLLPMIPLMPLFWFHFVYKDL